MLNQTKVHRYIWYSLIITLNTVDPQLSDPYILFHFKKCYNMAMQTNKIIILGTEQILQYSIDIFN